MMQKKIFLYYLTICILTVLTAFTCAFGTAVYQEHPVAFCFLIGASALCFVFLVLTVALNYKKVRAIRQKMIKEIIEALEYSVVEKSVDVYKLRQRLEEKGYKQLGECLYMRYERIGRYRRYYYKAMIIEEKDVLYPDIHTIDADIPYFSESTAYIFLDGKLEENLREVMSYVREVNFEIEKNIFSGKRLFSPIIITKEKVYFIEAKGLVNSYTSGIKTGLEILDITLEK